MNKHNRLNILFISQLYPLSENSKNSLALHNFVKEWSRNHNVQVVRPYLEYEENRTWFKEKNPKVNQVIVEDILVDVVYPKWIPVLKLCIINKKKVISLINNKPDIIFCHLYNSYLTFAFLKSHYGVPFIVGIHNSDLKLARSFFQRWRMKNVIDNADGVAYRSELIREKFNSLIKLSNKKTYIANSGLSEEQLRIAEQQFKENRQKGRSIKIISVCWLIKRKRIDSVIKTLSRINSETNFNWSYTIIGEGSEKARLVELVKKFKLESKIVFKGRVSKKEVLKSMKMNDVFIMPSTNETLGLAYLEAMASGCFVIGSSGWGIDGIIQHGVNGFLCDPISLDDIFDKLYQVMSMPDKEFADIKQRSIKTVLNLSNKKIANDFLEFFEPKSVK